MIDKEATEVLRKIYSLLEGVSELSIESPDYDQTQIDYLVDNGYLEKIDASTLSGWAYIIRPTYKGKNYIQQLSGTKLSKIIEFIERGEKIRNEELISPDPGIIAPESIKGPKTNSWLGEIHIFNERHLRQHPLHDDIYKMCKKNVLLLSSFDKLMGCLEALKVDPELEKDSFEKFNHSEEFPVSMYDVFISHANADKMSYIEELKSSLDKMGIKIFYDKETLEWGDKWKDKILEGVEKAEFAIIVISENFFDREWTERELKEFLERQNTQGQKIILPILHDITIYQLQEKYPSIADIQCINSSDHSCDEIALLFAKQLIKRLKTK